MSQVIPKCESTTYQTWVKLYPIVSLVVPFYEFTVTFYKKNLEYWNIFPNFVKN